jgi:DNA polymerase type B, organellar and viral
MKMMKQKKAYSTDSANTGLLLNRMYQKIERTTHQDPHPGLIIASHHFFEPYPLVNEIDLLNLATMDLLIQFAYPSLSGYGKFTISFTMKRSYGEEISFTLGPAIPLTYHDCKLIPRSEVYAHISRSIMKYSEIYDGDYIIRLMIRVYMDGKKMDWPTISSEERDSSLSSIIQARLSEIEQITAREIRKSKRSYPTHITTLKPWRTALKPFMVADTETILIDNVHKPYAAGLMMVRPGERINDIMIDSYFSEDYSIILDSFEERSTKVLYDLVLRISRIVRQEKSTLTIYFHNFSRFDGILLLKHLACHHKSYKLKPLMRNHRLYELAVYSGNKMLFCFRDSLNLLPGKLSDLAYNLCPGLGPKGSIPYDEVTQLNLVSMKKSLLDYMKQDILLLGGVMQKAQEIYWKLYKVDIESKVTLSSLALSIFRMKYYDASNWPIHIPNKNEDCFIRRAYYGGHTDTYKPYGEDLYYYDVNSLYPFVMKDFPMPGGVPIWHGNLEGKDLDSIFGFIEAYVECPKTIKKPFLPYRDKNNTLIFPTGEFVGVYYSEELKYARGLGYTVVPISGYLFEKMESPLRNFVSSLFESRLEAKISGNESLSYVYKILMNSLYGRFGINPKSTITEICDEDRYKDLIRHRELIFGDMLNENNYIVAYQSNVDKGSDDYWNPPKNSAVQLSAAITAAARIYMYPYISREDCYYTDTDSVVLGQPLPKEVISSSVLGKFKQEDRILKGYFLAPKSYFYIAKDGSNVLKYKGPAKNQVNPEWFQSQYADPSRTKQVPVKANFRIDWRTLNIIKKDTLVSLGIKLESKRMPVYHKEVWVDTEPIDIKDLSRLDNIGKQIIKYLRNLLETEKSILKEKLSQKEREIEERYKEKSQFYAKKNTDKKMHTQSTTEIQTRLTEDKTLLDKEEEEPIEVTNPTLDDQIKTDEIPNTDEEKPP